MKVLINVPKLSLPGGVTSLFNILKINKHYDNVDYFEISNNLPKLISLPLKYIEFAVKIMHYDVIHLNPSLNSKSFFRDALFAFITKLFNKKLIVYWHGWDYDFERKMKNSSFSMFIFNTTYKKADNSIVLGTVFKNKLEDLGFKNRIIIETNTAENKYIESEIHRNIKTKEIINLLFLSRIEEQKGIYIAIETLKLLNKNELKFKLFIAGSGSLENEIKRIAENSEDIIWVGYVDGIKKHQLLLESDIMFFPTYYPEGMPLTLLEAMMYGLPIVSRPVGGIPDIVENDINGIIIDTKNPVIFAKNINMIILPEKYREISNNNFAKCSKFNPKVVRQRLMKIYENTNR